MVCPPATLIAAFRGGRAGSALAIGGQDCHAEPSGAFTGRHFGRDAARTPARAPSSSATPSGAQYHGETDAQVRAKAQAAWRAGLMAIVCVGETKDQRTGGETLDVVGTQLDGSIPDGATAANAGRRLRAGLGDRDRADADAGRRRAKCTPSSARG